MDKEIFIIRHGQTDFNKQGVVQGRGVDSSLNDTGRMQADYFFEAFKDYGFEKIYISSLKRTFETVQPFIEKLNLPYEIHPELDEIDWGQHEGKQADTLLRSEYNKIIKSWSDNILHVSTPGGESPIDLQARQQIFIDYIMQEPVEKALVCTHGRAMRSLLCTISDMDLCKMDEFPHNNLSLYKVNYKNGKFDIHLFNNRDHLIDEN